MKINLYPLVGRGYFFVYLFGSWVRVKGDVLPTSSIFSKWTVFPGGAWIDEDEFREEEEVELEVGPEEEEEMRGLLSSAKVREFEEPR